MHVAEQWQIKAGIGNFAIAAACKISMDMYFEELGAKDKEAQKFAHGLLNRPAPGGWLVLQDAIHGITKWEGSMHSTRLPATRNGEAFNNVSSCPFTHRSPSSRCRNRVWSSCDPSLLGGSTA
ncbi:hypothetical protein MUK42_07669 [Musa troglodytarum]|uniref:Uncharacterized protein n=1 Tax=Musa troglodytarum TaxID=320322 RepID=A0A9E7HRY7_9LILI|nr:hypothetical protein MUK42_07669 [Musa troglodytarum]